VVASINPGRQVHSGLDRARYRYEPVSGELPETRQYVDSRPYVSEQKLTSHCDAGIVALARVHPGTEEHRAASLCIQNSHHVRHAATVAG
jgi:hypothetical protein